MLITFSGIDGSGKTTQAHFAVSLLRSWGIDSQQIHLTQWTWVYQIGAKIAKSQRQNNATSISPARLGLHCRLLRLSVMMADVFRFNWLLRQTKKHEQILVCDRYFYDLGIHALYSGIMPYRMARVYWTMIPQPQLAFLLEVSPDLAEQREGEHVLAYYQQKQILYRRESQFWPVQVVPTDGLDSTREALFEKLKALIAD